MKRLGQATRLAVTVTLLVALVVLIRPDRLRSDLAQCDWRWLVGAVALAPAFLWCRVRKWMALENQVASPAGFLSILPRYLWGMTLGLVTPGRLGEVARARGRILSAGGGGLFVLEKAIEVCVLLSLCLLTVPLLIGAGVWVWGLCACGVLAAVVWWRRIATGAARWASCRLCPSSSERLLGFVDSAGSLRLRACVVLSVGCFVVYCVQAWLVLASLGVSPRWPVLASFPGILLANLAPITVGGYGLRETLAVFVLKPRSVAPGQAVISVAFVTFVNLVVPALAGVLVRPAAKQSPEATPDTSGEEDSDWDAFWQRRRKRLLGRILDAGRRRFVTRALADYLERNTEKGVLVEAGCGSGEVSLLLASRRGDRLVLVDRSSEALALAGRMALEYGVKADLLPCDILELPERLTREGDATVFNVGVVEHFADPGEPMRAMVRAGTRPSIAVIPERSVFWLTFFRISSLLGLVPHDFFVRFYSRKQLARIVADAGLHALWFRRVRVLGCIPYLGVCFDMSAGLKGDKL